MVVKKGGGGGGEKITKKGEKKKKKSNEDLRRLEGRNGTCKTKSKNRLMDLEERGGG